MNPVYFNALHCCKHFLIFTEGTSLNFLTFKLLEFKGFFVIRTVFVLKLLRQIIVLGQLLLAFKSAQLEIIWLLKSLQDLLVSHCTLSCTQP